MSHQILVESLTPVLPPILWRHRWNEYRDRFGLPFARGTMENLDCMGTGPRCNRHAGKVFYTKDDYLAWLAALDQEKSRA